MAPRAAAPLRARPGMRALSALLGLASLLALPPGAGAADEPARGRLRILLTPVRANPVHESRWARDATATLRRELSQIPWIEVVEPIPTGPERRMPDLSDWSRAIHAARALRCDAFLRGELKACTCDSREQTRNPWQAWISIDLTLDDLGDLPQAEASDEDHVNGASQDDLDNRVPQLVDGLVVGVIPQLLAARHLEGRVVAPLGERRFLVDRGLADGVHTGARLTLVRPETKGDAVKVGELEVTSVAESTAVAVLRSGSTPTPDRPWRMLPPKPVTGGGTIRGLVQSLGSEDRCCP